MENLIKFVPCDVCGQTCTESITWSHLLGFRLNDYFFTEYKIPKKFIEKIFNIEDNDIICHDCKEYLESLYEMQKQK